MAEALDVLIVGSGIGGATAGCRPRRQRRARSPILERGEQSADEPAARDARAIFVGQTTGPKNCGETAQGAFSTPATTTMSAATRNSTARSCCATASATSRRSSTSAAPRPAGRSPMASSSPGTGGRTVLPGARRRGPGPDRAAATRSPILPRRCRTSRASPPCASGLARAGPACRSRCRWPSTSSAGCSGPRRPGTPSPTPAAASSTPRPSALAAGAAQSRSDAGDRRQGRAPAAGAATARGSRASNTSRTARRGGCGPGPVVSRPRAP